MGLRMNESRASRLEELAIARNIARKKVVDWMNAEGKAGRLRHNDQAPAWREYEAAQNALDVALAELGQAEQRAAANKCGFMDGVDWQHHLGQDAKGTRIYASVASLKDGIPHIEAAGCGVVEVEVRFIRWVEAQDIEWDYDSHPPSTQASETSGSTPLHQAGEGK